MSLQTGQITLETVELEERKIVVLIPAYNEERSIGSVVLKARKFADVVLVIDDGSSDMTAEIARDAGAEVVCHPENRGKGTALNTGFQEVRRFPADAIVLMDGDGQHLPEELPILAAPILNGEADIVVGTRYLEKTSDVPVHRVYGHQVFNFITSQASGVNLSDSQNGFRAFSPYAASLISLKSNGFSVESEMQFIAHDHKLRVMEMPITILYHEKPKRPVMSHGWMVLNGILHMIGQYRPLLFFGVSGMVVLFMGMGWGIWVVDIYNESRELAVGYALISVLLVIVGMLALFTGITLHSVRGILLEMMRTRHIKD
jgi:glycosyltransferase involved in cell wall biosynthesis